VIVTDSGAAIPTSLQAAYRIVTVPLRITIAGESYIDGVNISPPRIVAALLGGEKVTVHEPSAADFASVYGRLSDAGVGGIVSIHLSHRMHDVVARANEAAAGARVLVRVIDSGTVAMAQGLVALSAAALARDGATLADVERAATRTNGGARLMLTVATMDYLFRDGRVPRVLKSFSNAANMRPLLSVVDGDVKMVARVRGTDAARARVRDEMKEYHASLGRAAVAVSLVGGSAAEAGLAIGAPGSLEECSPGASLTAHAGPGTYAVAVAPMPEEYVM